MSGYEAELIKRIDSLEKRVIELESKFSAGGKLTDIGHITLKNQSVREFLLTKKPTTANDHTLILGYYVEHVSGHGYFSADDIKAAYLSAKLSKPKNVNDTINKNIAKGFMMESGMTETPVKTWVLTTSGEEYTEKELNIKND